VKDGTACAPLKVPAYGSGQRAATKV